MSNQLSVLDKATEFEVNGEPVKLTGNMVKQYLTHGNGAVSDQELVMFINLCKYQKLNPFLNEAYLIKFGSQPAQIIVSKEAFMKRAENHPKYRGLEAGIVVERNGEIVDVEGAIKMSEDKLLGGWCKVYREDRAKPITVKISLDEFSKQQATWKQMPNNMIRKTAIVNALREAFPETLAAMYTEEEAPPQPAVKQQVQEEIKSKANTEIIDIKAEEVKPVEERQAPKQSKPEPEPELVKAYPDEPAEDQFEMVFDAAEGPGY